MKGPLVGGGEEAFSAWKRLHGGEARAAFQEQLSGLTLQLPPFTVLHSLTDDTSGIHLLRAINGLLPLTDVTIEQLSKLIT